MTKFAKRAGIPVFSLLLLSSCASLQGSCSPDFEAEACPADRRIPLVVENHGWTDLHLFAVRADGTRLRLGRVESLEGRTVTLPRTLAGQRIRFAAVPAILGAEYLTESVMLQEGVTIHLNLENQLLLSTLFVSGRGRIPRL